MIYLKQKAVGIDKQIEVIQNTLNRLLKWDNIDIYGRVYRNESKVNGIVPEVYIGYDEYRDVFLNDKVNATISFIDNESHDALQGGFFETDLKIVFCVNLSKLKPSGVDRQDMDVEVDALKVVNKCKMFTLQGLEKGVDEVFNGFNTDNVKISDMQPYHVFAIVGKLKYKINC